MVKKHIHGEIMFIYPLVYLLYIHRFHGYEPYMNISFHIRENGKIEDWFHRSSYIHHDMAGMDYYGFISTKKWWFISMVNINLWLKIGFIDLHSQKSECFASFCRCLAGELLVLEAVLMAQNTMF